MRAGASEPASSIVPTSVRTMCRRNPFAVIVRSSRSPACSQDAASTSARTPCLVSVGVNARKSCSPSRSAAADCSVSRSTARGHQSARRASSADRVAGCGSDAGANAPRSVH